MIVPHSVSQWCSHFVFCYKSSAALSQLPLFPGLGVFQYVFEVHCNNKFDPIYLDVFDLPFMNCFYSICFIYIIIWLHLSLCFSAELYLKFCQLAIVLHNRDLNIDINNRDYDFCQTKSPNVNVVLTHVFFWSRNKQTKNIYIYTVGTESIQTPLNFSLFVILQPFAKII